MFPKNYKLPLPSSSFFLISEKESLYQTSNNTSHPIL